MNPLGVTLSSPGRRLSCLVALLAVANLVMLGFLALAQRWTNSHTLGHGSLFGPILAGALLCVAASSSFTAVPWRRLGASLAVVGAVHVAFVAYWGVRFFTLSCEGCAAGG